MRRRAAEDCTRSPRMRGSPSELRSRPSGMHRTVSGVRNFARPISSRSKRQAVSPRGGGKTTDGRFSARSRAAEACPVTCLSPRIVVTSAWRTTPMALSRSSSSIVPQAVCLDAATSLASQVGVPIRSGRPARTPIALSSMKMAATFSTWISAWIASSPVRSMAESSRRRGLPSKHPRARARDIYCSILTGSTRCFYANSVPN